MLKPSRPIQLGVLFSSVLFLALPCSAQLRFRADAAPKSQQISYEHERAGSCPKPSLRGPSGSRPPGPINEDLSAYFSGGSRFSCPILHFDGAMVGFAHPLGGMLGEIEVDDVNPDYIVLPEAPSANVVAEGAPRDDEGGDRHGFLAAVAVNVDTTRPNRPSLNPMLCDAAAGVTTQSPTSGPPLKADNTCALTRLKVLNRTVNNDRVETLEAELISDAWFKADHGSGRVGNIQNGARYRVTVRTVYIFQILPDDQQMGDRITATAPNPPTSEPLSLDSAHEMRATGGFRLSSGDKGDIIGRVFDQTGRQITQTAPIPVTRGEGAERVITSLFAPGPEVQKVRFVLYLRDEAGAVLAQSPPLEWDTSVELSVSRLEVVQVVQTPQNSVPLIRNKPTVVRVFTKVEAENIQAVGQSEVELHGKRFGSELPNSPLRLVAVSVRNPDRREQSHTHDFLLPRSWLEEGSLEITAVVNPDQQPLEVDFSDNEKSMEVSFKPSKPLRIGWVNICWQLEDKNPCGQGGRGGPFVSLRDMYPVEPQKLSFGAAPINTVQFTPPKSAIFNLISPSYFQGYNEKILRAQLESLYWRLVRGHGPISRPYDNLLGWLPMDKDIEYLTLGFATFGGHSAFVLDQVFENGKVGDDTLRSTVAHEVGHNYRLHHTNKPDSNKAFDSSSDWPFGDSHTQELGFSPREGTIKLGKDYGRFDAWNDLMTYWNAVWMSEFHYRKLLAHFADLDGSVIFQDATQRYALITGEVLADGSFAELKPPVVVETEDSGDGLTPEGNHCLELAGAGAVLGTHCFDLDFQDEGRGTALPFDVFAKLVPFPEGVTSVRLLRGGVELASLTASDNAPMVAITSPAPDSIWDAANLQTIRWTAEDADGDALTYTVSYSPDGGQTWLPLAQDLQTMELTFDPSLIQGGAGLQFEVEATDGLGNGVAQVGPVEVIQRPAIAVDSPAVLGRTPAGVRAVRRIALRNPGSGPLRVESVSIDDERFEVDPGQFPLTVQAGGQAPVEVAFELDETGDVEVTGSAVSNASDAPSLSFQIAASADDGQTPVAAVADSPRRFLPAFVGDFTELQVSVANESLVELTLEASVGGDGMELSEAAPTPLAPGETGVVRVTFRPERTGEHAGELVILTNDPAAARIGIPLVGNALEAVDAGPQLPTISAGGVVDAAQFQATLSPGGLGSVFGSNLAPAVGGATSTPLPTVLEGASIQVDGVPAPLIFVSPNQINFQMPFEAAGKSSVEIRAVRDGVAGPPVQADVATFAPQVFANPATGEPIVVRQDASLVNAFHPATDGEVFILYLTGVGGLDNPPTTGGATPGSPLAAATAETTVTIGGQPAEVFFNGLTPGFVGLAQVNIRASLPALPGAALSPEGAAVLTTMPLVVTVDGVSSEPLDLPVDVPGGLPPQIDVQPFGLDFGEVSLGQSGELFVTVFNRGGQDMIVSPVSAAPSEFRALAPSGPWSVAIGNSQRIPVKFTPTSVGTSFGTLTIVSSDPNNPEVQVPLVGRGVDNVAPPTLTITPGSFDFGEVTVGQSVSSEFTITNSGAAPVTVTGVLTNSPSIFDVSLVGAETPLELAPGASVSGAVMFQPPTVGPFLGNLRVETGSVSTGAVLQGVGVEAPEPPFSSLVVTRNLLNYGLVSLGRTNELPLIVRNDGASAQTISEVSSTNPQFVLAAPVVPITVEPGQEALLRIHYTPAQLGPQQATLTVSTPSGPLQTTVKVTGTGWEGPKILFSDSFERPDAAACALGVADNAFGGSGSHRYSAIAAGARLEGGRLVNVARDFGGVAFSTEPSACPGAATTTGEDLNIRATVFVPRSGDRSTQAGPFFHAPKLTSGATLHGGGKAGHWVQVDSSGTIYAIRLDTGQVVATSLPVPGFDASIPHVIEVGVRGATAEVAIDGRLRVFDQGAGTGRTSISLVPTGALSQGGAGVGFSAYDGPGSVGGQTADDIIVTEHEALAGLPVWR